jgi:hypothetical protein
MNRPVALAVAAALIASVFVAARLSKLDWDASRFVLAGQGLSDPAHVPKSLYVLRGATGYDGQAYYRLALDPLTTRKTDRGITLDSPSYRQQRIVYPALSWALSGGGRAASIPWVMIALNVAAMIALGWIGGAIALALGKNVWTGAAFVLYPGFVVSLARDLPEPIAAAFLLAGLLLLRRSRPTAAAVVLTLAVLTRETTAVLAFGLATAWLFDHVRGRAPGFAARVFVAPLGVLVVWQLFLYARWNSLPVLSNPNATDPPFVGIANHLGRFVRGHGFLALSEIALAAVLLVAVLALLRSERIRSYERWAFLAAAVLVIVLDHTVWEDHAHFLRAMTEFYVLGAVALLAALKARHGIRFFVPVVMVWAPVARAFVRDL